MATNCAHFILSEFSDFLRFLDSEIQSPKLSFSKRFNSKLLRFECVCKTHISLVNRQASDKLTNRSKFRSADCNKVCPDGQSRWSSLIKSSIEFIARICHVCSGTLDKGPRDHLNNFSSSDNYEL